MHNNKKLVPMDEVVKISLLANETVAMLSKIEEGLQGKDHFSESLHAVLNALHKIRLETMLKVEGTIEGLRVKLCENQDCMRALSILKKELGIAIREDRKR